MLVNLNFHQKWIMSSSTWTPLVGQATALHKRCFIQSIDRGCLICPSLQITPGLYITRCPLRHVEGSASYEFDLQPQSILAGKTIFFAEYVPLLFFFQLPIPSRSLRHFLFYSKYQKFWVHLCLYRPASRWEAGYWRRVAVAIWTDCFCFEWSIMMDRCRCCRWRCCAICSPHTRLCWMSPGIGIVVEFNLAWGQGLDIKNPNIRQGGWRI